MGFSWWLTLAFIVLKLTGYIDWSWWWVISPIMIKILFLALINGLLSVLETDEERKVKKILDRLKKK
jgi:uncharacterized membrane protein YhdT